MTKKQILKILNDRSTYILDFKDETHNAIELEDFNDVADAILSLCSSSLQLPNDNNETPYIEDLVNFRSFGIEDVSNTNLIEFNKIIIEEIHKRKNKQVIVQNVKV